jgi:hypothetical protein
MSGTIAVIALTLLRLVIPVTLLLLVGQWMERRHAN